MKPKKNLIEQAQKDGSMDRLNSLLSASHILLCEADNLIEEGADLMADKGLMLGKLKKLHKDFVRSADAYFKEFAEMVTTDSSKMEMFGDLDDFDSRFRIWARIYKNWKPKEIQS